MASQPLKCAQTVLGALQPAPGARGSQLPRVPQKDTEQPNHSHCCRRRRSLCVPVLLTEPMCAEAGQIDLGLTSLCGNRSPWAPPGFSPRVGSTEGPGQVGPRGFRPLEVSRAPGGGPGAEQHCVLSSQACPTTPQAGRALTACDGIPQIKQTTFK